MNTETTPIPEADSRLSNINRFYETQHEWTTSSMRQKTAIYCILNDTAVKTYTWWSTGTYVFDNMTESWWFTLVSNQVNIPQDWRFYVGTMTNWYQYNLWQILIELKPTWQKSACSLLNNIRSYWYPTLWMSNILKLAKNDKIYITYDIQGLWSANTVWDYTQNRLMIFEMPFLSIN